MPQREEFDSYDEELEILRGLEDAANGRIKTSSRRKTVDTIKRDASEFVRTAEDRGIAPITGGVNFGSDLKAGFEPIVANSVAPGTVVQDELGNDVGSVTKGDTGDGKVTVKKQDGSEVIMDSAVVKEKISGYEFGDEVYIGKPEDTDSWSKPFIGTVIGRKTVTGAYTLMVEAPSGKVYDVLEERIGKKATKKTAGPMVTCSSCGEVYQQPDTGTAPCPNCGAPAIESKSVNASKTASPVSTPKPELKSKVLEYLTSHPAQDSGRIEDYFKTQGFEWRDTVAAIDSLWKDGLIIRDPNTDPGSMRFIVKRQFKTASKKVGSDWKWWVVKDVNGNVIDNVQMSPGIETPEQAKKLLLYQRGYNNDIIVEPRYTSATPMAGKKWWTVLRNGKPIDEVQFSSGYSQEEVWQELVDSGDYGTDIAVEPRYTRASKTVVKKAQDEPRIEKNPISKEPQQATESDQVNNTGDEKPTEEEEEEPINLDSREESPEERPGEYGGMYEKYLSDMVTQPEVAVTIVRKMLEQGKARPEMIVRLDSILPSDGNMNKEWIKKNGMALIDEFLKLEGVKAHKMLAGMLKSAEEPQTSKDKQVDKRHGPAKDEHGFEEEEKYPNLEDLGKEDDVDKEDEDFGENTSDWGK